MGAESGVDRWPPWAGRTDGAAAGPLDLEALHDEHADFVWRSLQQLGVRSADLEDLLQEVFVVVHRRLSTFDPDAPVRPWLFGICRRVASVHRRRAHVWRETPGGALRDDHEAGIEHRSPEDDYRAQQERARLEEILDTLDSDKRAVFVMFEIDELSCEEIAAALGVPVGTVYSRLHAARKAFEKALARIKARESRGGGK